MLQFQPTGQYIKPQSLILYDSVDHRLSYTTRAILCVQNCRKVFFPTSNPHIQQFANLLRLKYRSRDPTSGAHDEVSPCS